MPFRHLPAWRERTSSSGRVTLVLDAESFDFHYDVTSQDDVTDAEVVTLLMFVDLLGFEPIPDDEDPPVLLDDGVTFRTYLCPKVPVPFESTLRVEL